jgi:hypothetical protein
MRWGRGSALLPVLVTVLAGLTGCGLDGELPPNPVQVVALPVPRRVELPNGGTEERRRLVDGNATGPEWSAVPYTNIAMGPEFGNGGGTFLTSIKVAHDTSRVYFLIQWPDDTPDRLGPRFVYNGVCCDSLTNGCTEWALHLDDEDRVAIMWDINGARDGAGTFRDRGCQVACHGDMHPVEGAVDIWHWRAARTNPIQFPLFGSLRVGFADDGYADAGGRVEDPGLSLYRSNVQMVECAGGGTVARPLKVPNALDDDGRPTIQNNDFMRPCEYIFDPDAFAYGVRPRPNPCREFEQEDFLDWDEGDDLSATLLNRPANEAARQSRHDVEARGTWTGTNQGGQPTRGVWTVELSRTLNTGRPEDLGFDLSAGETYTMAIAIMNNGGTIHSGSPPIQIQFQR